MNCGRVNTYISLEKESDIREMGFDARLKFIEAEVSAEREISI